MIVEVLESFKVTEGKVYVGGTTIEVDRFGALHPDVQRELMKKSNLFRLVRGYLPGEEPPPEAVEPVEETPPEVVDPEEEKAEDPGQEETAEAQRTLPRKQE